VSFGWDAVIWVEKEFALIFVPKVITMLDEFWEYIHLYVVMGMKKQTELLILGW
jgi:hypothetical protein